MKGRDIKRERARETTLFSFPTKDVEQKIFISAKTMYYDFEKLYVILQCIVGA